MEKQIAAMQGTISAVKQQQYRKKPLKRAALQSCTPTTSSSSISSVDDELTFDQKEELSEAIRTLHGEKLERVIEIIQDGVPELRGVCLFYLFSRSSHQLLTHALFVPRELIMRSLNSISTLFQPTS